MTTLSLASVGLLAGDTHLSATLSYEFPRKSS